MATPLFSIIIPTFNAGKTLSFCLDSVLIQSFQDFEILIIDAVSSDNTMSIVEEYAAANTAITWISEKDKGIYDAMNKSISLAKGEWLYFLGSDDKLYDAEVLKKIMNSLNENHSLDVLYGNVSSNRLGIYDGEFNAGKIRLKNICHQAIFLRKTVFEKVGLYNIKYRANADWDHNFRWFFSDLIQKKHVDILVAVYADGGFSSVNNDDEFISHRRLNYLNYGHNQLTWRRKFIIVMSESLAAIAKGDIKKLIMVIRQFRFLLP